MSALPPSAAIVNAVLKRSLTVSGNLSTALRAAPNHPIGRVSSSLRDVVINDNIRQSLELSNET